MTSSFSNSRHCIGTPLPYAGYARDTNLLKLTVCVKSIVPAPSTASGFVIRIQAGHKQSVVRVAAQRAVVIVHVTWWRRVPHEWRQNDRNTCKHGDNSHRSCKANRNVNACLHPQKFVFTRSAKQRVSQYACCLCSIVWFLSSTFSLWEISDRIFCHEFTNVSVSQSIKALDALTWYSCQKPFEEM